MEGRPKGIDDPRIELPPPIFTWDVVAATEVKGKIACTLTIKAVVVAGLELLATEVAGVPFIPIWNNRL